MPIFWLALKKNADKEMLKNSQFNQQKKKKKIMYWDEKFSAYDVHITSLVAITITLSRILTLIKSYL